MKDFIIGILMVLMFFAIPWLIISTFSYFVMVIDSNSFNPSNWTYETAVYAKICLFCLIINFSMGLFLIAGQ